jgi:hypothetical protein
MATLWKKGVLRNPLDSIEYWSSEPAKNGSGQEKKDVADILKVIFSDAKLFLVDFGLWYLTEPIKDSTVLLFLQRVTV